MDQKREMDDPDQGDWKRQSDYLATQIAQRLADLRKRGVKFSESDLDHWLRLLKERLFAAMDFGPKKERGEWPFSSSPHDKPGR